MVKKIKTGTTPADDLTIIRRGSNRNLLKMPEPEGNHGDSTNQHPQRYLYSNKINLVILST
jgi:hypothetical protein